MSKKKDRRLGQGLAALLGGMESGEHAQPAPETPIVSNPFAQEAPAPEPAQSDSEVESESSDDGLIYISVDEIDPNPYQPRRDFQQEEIESLAASLESHQMLQPILVRRLGDRYQLISGERRLRAASHAQWPTIPAQVREADDRTVAELAIVENLQRKDLNAIEKALSFKHYIDQHHCKQEELAQRLNLDRSTIANLMRLLELPQPILDSIRDERLSQGHARALLPLGEEEEQIAFAKKIEQEGWSVREVERQVKEVLEQDESHPRSRKPRSKNQHLVSLEQELRHALGTKVSIKQRGEKGQISIHFNNSLEFERLRDLIIGLAREAEAA